MSAPVLLTVDTELTWRHHAPGDGWRANFERSIEPAGVGLSYQLATLAKHGLSACFFVDPMPALLYGIEPIAQIVAPILAAGQEVQLHLHPQWQWLAEGRDSKGIELSGLDYATQRQLIGRARNLLVEAGAPAPIAFRGGSFGANADTLRALADLGFRYDSSHNGSHRPWPSALPLARDLIAPTAIEGIIEFPVTQIEDRPGSLRHLQICAVSRDELIGALDHAAMYRHPMVTIVSHSFELATRDGRRANATVRDRFESLCGHLGERRTQHPTMRFDRIGRIALDVPARPLPAHRLRTARRFAEQVWSSSRYERPVEAATATAGSSVPGIEMLLPLIGI
jgi:hypothetical protein